jgi:hypothetical protein
MSEEPIILFTNPLQLEGQCDCDCACGDEPQEWEQLSKAFDDLAAKVKASMGNMTEQKEE